MTTDSLARAPTFTNPSTTLAWQQLAAMSQQPRAAWLPSPIEGAGLTLDISRQRLDPAVWSALEALLGEMQFETRRDAFLSGEAINITEGRAVLHPALRDRTARFASAKLIGSDVNAALTSMAALCNRVHRGTWRSIADHAFTDAVVIGIGGSALGPELVCSALTRASSTPAAFKGLAVHFVANIDGAAMDDTLATLDPARTLVVVISKTFTTEETLANAAAARAWLCTRLGEEAFARQSIAITARPAEAIRQGYPAEQVLSFWDSIGGRFSLWSTVGLPIALAHGMDAFTALLEGAHAMDVHFATAPTANNLPVVLALIGIWNRNFQSMSAHAVLPYAQRLSLLSKHLQQLEMESTGKSVDLNGERVEYSTCPIIFGEPGTNGQHSFHQLLHQGTDANSADVIIVKTAESALPGHHTKLLANAFAQADAWWQGRTFETAFEALNSIGDPDERRRQAMHRVHEGLRPVTMIELPRLDAYSLGALIAGYEHKVFTQGVLWNVNSFDQFGVELGKVIARNIEPRIANAQAEAEALRQGDDCALLTTLRHV